MALFYVDCVSQQHLDETGVPMQGYITCTTIQGTAKPMYMDNSSSPVPHGAHANLDARGYVCIWVDGDTPSHFYLYDSYGRLVNSWLNITCKQGAVGPQGPQGATGATGAKGDKGDTGPQGERGLTGPAGSDGRVMTFDDLTAEQKASLKGEQGERGATGATGAQGATGQQGPQGVQGDKGDTGPIGRGLEIDWPCSTKAELLQVTHPQVGDVASVATDTIGEQTVNGTLYVWTMTNGTGSWQYHGTLGNTSSSVTGISFNANTITITQSGNNHDVTANVPTFNQNTTGTAAKATNAYNDEDGVSIKTYYAKKTDIPEGVELTSNKITAVVSTSTNTEYPSGKAVWDICDTKADDDDVVHKSDIETITGTKTFTQAPTLNQGIWSYGNLRLNHNGATSYHQIYTDSTNERYDVKLPNKSGTLAVDNDVVHKSGTETITGDKTFTGEVDFNREGVAQLRINNGTRKYAFGARSNNNILEEYPNISASSPTTAKGIISFAGTGNSTAYTFNGNATTASDVLKSQVVVPSSGMNRYHAVYTDTNGKNVRSAGNKEFLEVGTNGVLKKIGDLGFKGVIQLDNGGSDASNRFQTNISPNSSLTSSVSCTLPNKTGTLAVDSDVVHKTGNETISGEKTFQNQLNLGRTWQTGTATFNETIQLPNGFGAMIWNGASGKQGARLMKPSDPPATTESHDWYAVRMPNKGGTLAVDGDVVHKTGEENIGGTKRFNDDVYLKSNLHIATSGGRILFDQIEGVGTGFCVINRSSEQANLTLPNGTHTLATTDDVDLKQDTLTAGSNITISGATISATDTTYDVTSDADLDSIVSSLT